MAAPHDPQFAAPVPASPQNPESTGSTSAPCPSPQVPAISAQPSPVFRFLHNTLPSASVSHPAAGPISTAPAQTAGPSSESAPTAVPAFPSAPVHPAIRSHRKTAAESAARSQDYPPLPDDPPI